MEEHRELEKLWAVIYPDNAVLYILREKKSVGLNMRNRKLLKLHAK
jgi:hypothetical protein